MADSIWNSAVESYWSSLAQQTERQGALTGLKDYGNRAAVTGGRQMDGLQAAVASIWKSDPELPLEVRSSGKNNLPAYFRPAKNWDLTVLHRGSLVAAMEFKSQRGPSFGNNFNNRTEEALGLAADSQMAVERGLFGQLRPWFGFVMLVEEAPGSTKAVRMPIGMPFPADPIFEHTSYIDRYRIFFERMVTEGNYDSAALLVSNHHEAGYSEPSVVLSIANLQAEIQARMTYIKSLPDEVFDRLAL